MKTIKNNLPAVISISMIIAVSAIWNGTIFAIGQDIARQLIITLVGVIALTAVSFAKEKNLHKSALPVYLVVTAILAIHLLSSNIAYGTYYTRFLVLFDTIPIYTAALLPLTGIWWAKKIGSYKNFNLTYLFFTCVAVILPVLIVYFQPNTIPVLMSLLVMYIIIFAMSTEKRINIHPALFIIPVIAVIIAVIVLYKNGNSHYITDRIDVILSRGQSDPEGAGWIRSMIDSILTSTPFIGKTNSELLTHYDITEFLYGLSDYGIILVLAQFGWLAFIGIIACYGIFFASLFSMVKKTNQSTFAKYTSFILAIYLFVQAAISFLSVFLLDYSYIAMPFISRNYTTTIVNFVIFAIIFALYIRRNRETQIEELEFIEEEHFSILNAVKNIFCEENDDELCELDEPDIDFAHTERICKQLVETAEKLYKENPEKYSTELAESYYRAAQFYEESASYFDEAESFYLKALEIFEKRYEQSNHSDECAVQLSYCYHSTGRFFTTTTDYYRAEKYLLDAIKLKEGLLKDFSLKDDVVTPDNLIILGNLALTYHDTAECYEYQENYGNAENYYMLATSHYGIVNSTAPKKYARKCAKNLRDFGMFYDMQSKYTPAANCYLKAADILEELDNINNNKNNSDFITRDYFAAAKCYFNADKYPTFFKTFKNAVKLKSSKYIG